MSNSDDVSYKELHEEGLKRADRVLKGEARASGGRVHLTAGSVTGEGRLEKIAARKQNKAGDKAAEI